jgi:hypothetical protein
MSFHNDTKPFVQSSGDISVTSQPYQNETPHAFVRVIECAPEILRAPLPGQQNFSEPMPRINTDRLDGAALGWKEALAWEAGFYNETAGNNRPEQGRQAAELISDSPAGKSALAPRTNSRMAH